MSWNAGRYRQGLTTKSGGLLPNGKTGDRIPRRRAQANRPVDGYASGLRAGKHSASTGNVPKWDMARPKMGHPSPLLYIYIPVWEPCGNAPGSRKEE